MDTETDEVIAKLRETLQHAMDQGWHYFECRASRLTSARCTCGWTAAKERGERVLRETLDA